MESFWKHNEEQSLQWQHCYLRIATLNWTFVLNEGCKIGNYLHYWLFYSVYLWKWLMVSYPGNTVSDFYSSLLKLRAGTINVLLLLLKKGWQRWGALFGAEDTAEKKGIQGTKKALEGRVAGLSVDHGIFLYLFKSKCNLLNGSFFLWWIRFSCQKCWKMFFFLLTCFLFS